MALLANKKSKTLTYKKSKKYQKFLKKVAALQLTQLFKNFIRFKNSESNRLKFGVEQEMMLLTNVFPKDKCKENNVDNDDSTFLSKESKEYIVSLDIERYEKKLPKEALSSIELIPEYSAWMMEIIPKNPFKEFLSSKEMLNHFEDVDSLNKLDIELNLSEKSSKKRKHFILSMTSFAKIGYADFYVRPNGERIPNDQKSKINKLSKSRYFLDETVTPISRFLTFTRNTNEKRESSTEVNIPLFVDKNTRIIHKNLYQETKTYNEMSYKMEEDIRKKIKNKKELKVNLFIFIFIFIFLKLEFYINFKILKSAFYLKK